MGENTEARIIEAIDGMQQHVDDRFDGFEHKVDGRFSHQTAQIGEVALRLERIKACAEEAHEVATEVKTDGKELREQFNKRQLECEGRFSQVSMGFWHNAWKIALGLIVLGGFVMGIFKLIK